MSLTNTRRIAAPLAVLNIISFLGVLLPPRPARADTGPAAPISAIGNGTGGLGTLAGPPAPPNAPDALGTVDLSTGAGTSAFQFELPTARGDAQPALSLGAYPRRA